jgi:hypothetical protein
MDSFRVLATIPNFHGEGVGFRKARLVEQFLSFLKIAVAQGVFKHGLGNLKTGGNKAIEGFRLPLKHPLIQQGPIHHGGDGLPHPHVIQGLDTSIQGHVVDYVGAALNHLPTAGARFPL